MARSLNARGLENGMADGMRATATVERAEYLPTIQQSSIKFQLSVTVSFKSLSFLVVQPGIATTAVELSNDRFNYTCVEDSRTKKRHWVQPRKYGFSRESSSRSLQRFTQAFRKYLNLYPFPVFLQKFELNIHIPCGVAPTAKGSTYSGSSSSGSGTNETTPSWETYVSKPYASILWPL
ncbi:hypothetical protein BT96DRAFT_971473 [Gymnopus androsaceus JB14]|uniref:Uncharacterized protein n=1 Tax=Gymnopus androsaceus JB14 TaxID=1447944 RepID=A0A6A4IDW1_9AGAR|nr:hypothetical protein BT96DRAFT_971473 [Gymnopus androsaceus JB14]